MILVLITWLINGFLVSFVYALIAAMFHINIIHSPDWLILGYLSITLFMLLGISKAGHFLIKMYLGCRFAISRERQQVNPFLDQVLKSCNQKFQTNYQVDKVQIMIMDSKVPDSQAVGFNTIILTDGLLKNATDEELKAVLAYEVGHLYNRDSVVFGAAIFGNIAARFIMWLNSKYVFCFKFIMANARIFGNKGFHLLPVLAIIPLVIFFPIVIINFIIKHVFGVSVYMINRNYVYKADKFAKELGFGPGLISYLETLQEITYVDKSILGRIFATYPSAMKRIGNLEQ